MLEADGNGRRVLLTTRLEEVATCHSGRVHNIRFLNNEESWNLLQQNVFADESFPPQLENVGRKIAEKCESLPLLILAVANILCGLEKTQEYWKKVVDSKTTTFTEAYDQISEVLFSSYEYLPQHLKPCFLYMGVFPQKSEIPLPKLINLWTVEDVLEPESYLTKVARSRKIDALLEPKRSIIDALLEPEPFLTRVAGTSEHVAFSEPKRIETSVPRSSKKAYLARTCRYMRSLENLYLLEPGPSSTRFIKPLEKNDSLEPKQSRTREPSQTREPPGSRAMDTSVPTVMRTPKKFAMECLKKLVSNSVAMVCKQSSNNKIKSCKLHSAYWHLCVKEARNNKFFHVLNKLTDASKDYIGRQRRLSVQNNILFGIKEAYDSMATTLTARSLLCTGKEHEYPVPMCLGLMLLKVLDAAAIRFYEFPTEVLKLVQLRYLALTHNGELPSSISKLRQLQFLILRQHHNIKLLRDSTCLPKNIWFMEQLVYLRIIGSNLPDPSDDADLPNLLTLHVNAHSCTDAVFRSIPLLKKLGIKIELQPDAAETLKCFEHIGVLDGLKSLKCVIMNPRQRSNVVAPPAHLSNLPTTLKKLSLNGIGYPWKYMEVIGSLPNLKVLKLRCSAFRGPEWKTKVGGFETLEYLLLEDMDLVQWRIDNDNCFPHLQRLLIRHCYKLAMIPHHIRGFPTLKTVEVVDCSTSVVASAHQIDSSVQVVVISSWNFR